MSFLRKDAPKYLVEILLQINNNKKLKFAVTLLGVSILVPLYKLLTGYKLVAVDKSKEKKENVVVVEEDEYLNEINEFDLAIENLNNKK